MAVDNLEAKGFSVEGPDIGLPRWLVDVLWADNFAVAGPGLSPALLGWGLPRYPQHLLPRNATWLMKVLAAAGQRFDTLPIEIDKLKDPLDIPEQFLPHIAFEYSVDVWSVDWPEQQKRAVAEAAIYLHQLKGTLYAIKEYARYADAEVVSVERPPMGVFSGPSLTKAEREEWLANLPQIRLWQYRENGEADLWKAFLNSSGPRRERSGQFCFGTFATPSEASSHLEKRAKWVVEGVETDTTVVNVGSDYQLRLSGEAGDGVFCDEPSDSGAYFIPSEAWKRLISVRPKSALPWRSAVTPTLQAVISEPERVVVSGDAGYGVFSDEPAEMGFFLPSTAAERIYDRYPVLGPDIAPRRPTCQFMNDGSRYGFPPHTAWLRTSIPGTRPEFAAGEGIVGVKEKFWLPHDDKPLAKVCDAVSAASRLSDKVLLDIGPSPRFVAGAKPLLADIDTLIVGRP